MLFREKVVQFEEVAASAYQTDETPLDDQVFIAQVKESIVKLIDRVYIDDVQKGKQ